MPGFYSAVARYYDAENADKTDDIGFYLSLADETLGPILDVGAGTGRVVLPLARAGHSVVGVDREPAMLEIARARVQRQPDDYRTLTLVEGDMSTYTPPQGTRFGLVLFTYNLLMHIHDQADQHALLRHVHGLLRDDGLLVIDLPNAGETFATEDSSALILERTFVLPSNGHMVLQQAVSVLDRATQFMRVTWIYDEIDGNGAVRRTVAPTVFRYFFYYEVLLLLERAGFALQETYGDVDGSPFEDGAPRMVLLAGRA